MRFCAFFIITPNIRWIFHFVRQSHPPTPVSVFIISYITAFINSNIVILYCICDILSIIFIFSPFVRFAGVIWNYAGFSPVIALVPDIFTIYLPEIFLFGQIFGGIGCFFIRYIILWFPSEAFFWAAEHKKTRRRNSSSPYLFFDNLPEMSCRIDQRFLMYRCIRFFGIAAE